MKNLLFIPLLFWALNISAQIKKKAVHKDLIFMPLTATPAPKATAVIKGNVKNFSDKSWELAITGDLTNYSVTIPVDKDGNFSKSVSIDGETEDIYLYLNDDAITICAQKNDTILLNWDNKDFKNTFRVSSPQPRVNTRLQTMMSVYDNCRNELMSLMRSMHADKAPDSVKYEKINNLYNKEMMIAAVHLEQTESQKLITDVYYKYVELLRSDVGLSTGFDLKIKDTSAVGKKLNRQFGPGTYRIESEYAYKNSNNYKQFIFNYVRFNNLSNSVPAKATDWPNKPSTWIPAWNEYNLGMTNLRLPEIRDWFATKEIELAFEFYPFNDASNVYKDFITKVKTPRYADSLKQFYAVVQLLKPGNPAPDFSLKNDKGEKVSLKSLRGKVVYIDFWGVGCGPCVYEIQNTTKPLHEKYKDKNVVFLNVCVDSDEKTWKNSLTSLKVSGTNLIAEGWTRNPVCQKYNITGIPHYITIGTDGKIVNNNAARPSQGDVLTQELDKALANR